MRIHRRNFLQIGAGIVLACTTNWMQKPQKSIASTKASLKIGYLPLAAGLPLYLALEKGYFKQAGLNVEAVKLSGEQQVKELMAGRIQGAANGVDSSDLAIGEIASPGLFKIIASNTIGGTLNSPWFGGSAAISTKFCQENPETARKYLDVYRRAIISIRENPEEARQYLEGYTELKGNFTNAAPLPEYRLYNEFTALDIEYFQKFFDLLHEKVEVASLLLKNLAIA